MSGPIGAPARDAITAVIPAAGRVPEGVLALANVSCPAMIPVAGRPVIDWTLRYLSGLGLRRFVIAVAERGTFVEDFVGCTFGRDLDVRFVSPSRDGGVGLTLLELLEAVETPRALCVLGDTSFTFEDASLLDDDAPFVLVGPVEDSRRWCIAEVDEAGLITRLHDKQEEAPAPHRALIGVYGLPDVALAREATRAAVEAAERGGRRRTELSAVLTALAERSPLRAFEAESWLDVGNADRQASSHRTLLQKRAFNELDIDPVFGTITKRSRHEQKLIDEINYLRLLPPELSVLFPRLLDYRAEFGGPWAKMEYYGYPTLAEVFLFDNVDPAIWDGVIQHLFRIVTDGFMRHPAPLPESAIVDMYLTKTHERLQAARRGPEIDALISHEAEFVINGVPTPNLPLVWDRVIAIVDGWIPDAKGSVMHGDLCLSNILYDLRSRICKLIDPRGSFGRVGIHGDPLYDVAKLYHSFYGLYDFIVADVFEIRIEGTRIDLDIRARPQHQRILERFEASFFPHFDRRDVLLRTALLFASMPALHYDAPRRQLAMYTRALQLVHEALALPGREDAR